MKNLTIRSLKLMMMMIGVVYAARCSSPLKGMILDEAKRLSDNLSSVKNTPVAKPSIHSTVCVREFFCLAEKALKMNNSSDTVRLNGLLEQCNKGLNTTSCNLNDNYMYHLKDLLKDIMKCAAYPEE